MGLHRGIGWEAVVEYGRKSGSVVIFFGSVIYIATALFFYLVKEIWVYDRWKTQEKEVMKKDVYRVPVTIGETFRAGEIGRAHV